MPSTFDYHPQAKFEVKSFDVPYQKALGEPWEATIYQPQGKRAVSWHPVRPRRSLERSQPHTTGDIQHWPCIKRVGDCVGSFRLAPDHPYPAQVQDTRCGIKMAKAHASEFNASPDSVGGAGASSGGHTLMPSMRSHDPLFTGRRRPRRHGGLRDSRLAAVGLLRPLPVRPGYP